MKMVLKFVFSLGLISVEVLWHGLYLFFASGAGFNQTDSWQTGSALEGVPLLSDHTDTQIQ